MTQHVLAQLLLVIYAPTDIKLGGEIQVGHSYILRVRSLFSTGVQYKWFGFLSVYERQRQLGHPIGKPLVESLYDKCGDLIFADLYTMG